MPGCDRGACLAPRSEGTEARLQTGHRHLPSLQLPVRLPPVPAPLAQRVCLHGVRDPCYKPHVHCRSPTRTAPKDSYVSDVTRELACLRGRPTATPALATLALQLLNRQLRLDGAVHDVADDARAALDVALYEQQKGPSKQLAPPPMQVRLATGSDIRLMVCWCRVTTFKTRESIGLPFKQPVRCALSAHR